MAALLLQRDGELAALGRRLDQVRAGAGRVIVVEGPAGIGKSSLLAAAARLATGHGLRVLRACGGPLEQDAGWGIARQLFTPVHDGAEWAELAVGAAALSARALDPDDAEPALGGDAMHAASHGLTWLACTLADRCPTLLVVDDAHWCDPVSLRWLARLGHQLDGLALGVLCAVRSGEPASDPELLAELLAAAPDPPIRPTPLDPSAVEAIVCQRLPRAGRSFAHACHAATSGNPFLLRCLVDHLIVEQIEPTDDVGEGLSAFGPEQVARSVERQLARLPAGATSLARAFAVLGRGAPLRQADDLAELAVRGDGGGRDGEEAVHVAAHLADRLRAAGLLVSDGTGYALAHPLVATSLYAAIPPAERALWHRRAAAVLEADRADPEAVALHLLRSEPARDGATVDLLRRAAGRATRRGAPETASLFLRRALAEPPPRREVEAEVLSELGLSLAAGLHLDAPAYLRDAVAEAGTGELRSRIALSGARALGLAGRFDDAIRLCRNGLPPDDEQVPRPDEEPPAPGEVSAELRERLEAELVCNAWLQGATVAEARARLDRSTSTSALMAANRAWAVMAAGTAATECLAILNTVLQSKVLDGETDSLLSTLTTFALVTAGDLAAAEERSTALIDVARPRGWLVALAHGSFLRAMAVQQAGRIRQAETDARLSFEYKRATVPLPALLWSVFPLVDALTELDELTDAEAVLAGVGLLGDPPEGALASALLLGSRARLRLAQHRPDAALADAGLAERWWAGLQIVHPGLASWRVEAAYALTALEDRTTGRRLAEEHLALAERLGLAAPQAAGLRALAGTVERGQAVALLERADGLVAGSPARLEHTRVLVELGTALRRVNRRGAAEQPLRTALDLAERGGMRRLADQARRELQVLGARPRRSAVTGVDALTPAEHRVASLAAAGQSNREIAQQLYITRRTVETHLTHAFQKLDIPTRADLATHFPSTACS